MRNGGATHVQKRIEIHSPARKHFTCQQWVPAHSAVQSVTLHGVSTVNGQKTRKYSVSVRFL